MDIPLHLRGVKVCLGKSLIPGAGIGVFVTQPLREGEWICTYDATIGFPTRLNYNHFWELSDGTALIGYTSPRSLLGIGQYINDGSALILTDELRNPEDLIFKADSLLIKKETERYLRASLARENCTILGRNKRVYATRNLKVGEELYLHYGISHWLTWNQFATDEPFTRLSCLCLKRTIKMVRGLLYVDGMVYKPSLFLKEYLGVRPRGALMKACGLQGQSPTDQVKWLLEKVQGKKTNSPTRPLRQPKIQVVR